MCTAVRLTGSDGSMYFGRNLDWTTGFGEGVVALPSGCFVAPAFERPSVGTDPFDVIGTALVVEGVPLYYDCANTAGLAVAGLNFPQSAQYESSPRPGGIPVASYEFPLWIARHFGSVHDLRGVLDQVSLVGAVFAGKVEPAPLHWMVGDGKESLVIEATATGLHVYDNPADVLTNEPDFTWQLVNLQNYAGIDAQDLVEGQWGSMHLKAFGSGYGSCGLPGDYTGPSRFVKAAFLRAHGPVPTHECEGLAAVFHTLGAVSVPKGAARTASGEYEHTVYTSCFSASTMSYYVRSYDELSVRCYALRDIDLSARRPQVLS